MGEVKVWKGDKVKILNGEFKGEEGLIAVRYHWGLIGVLVFNDIVPRSLVWLQVEDVKKLKLREVKNEELRKAR